MAHIILTPDELQALTGYKRPNDQLRVLLRRGFHRAYIQNGRLVLERTHFEAICTGVTGLPVERRPRPKITLPQSLLDAERRRKA